MSSAVTPVRLTWSAATRDHFTDAGSMLRCLVIALVVGTILTAVNLGVVLANGRMSAGIAFAIAVNYLMPFLVSSLGAIATRHGRAGRASNQGAP